MKELQVTYHGLSAPLSWAAHRCKLGMTQTRFFELPGGLTAFATERFDRRGSQRIHVHSLAGLLHANFREPSVSYGDFFRLTRRLTRDRRQLKKAVQAHHAQLAR